MGQDGARYADAVHGPASALGADPAAHERLIELEADLDRMHDAVRDREAALQDALQVTV